MKQKIMISKRNVPIVEILPVGKEVPRRAIGQCKKKFEIPKSFFRPLPKLLVEAFSHPR